MNWATQQTTRIHAEREPTGRAGGPRMRLRATVRRGIAARRGASVAVYYCRPSRSRAVGVPGSRRSVRCLHPRPQLTRGRAAERRSDGRRAAVLGRFRNVSATEVSCNLNLKDLPAKTGVRHMKRAMLSAISIAIGLAACGGNSASSTSSSTAASAPATIDDSTRPRQRIRQRRRPRPTRRPSITRPSRRSRLRPRRPRRRPPSRRPRPVRRRPRPTPTVTAPTPMVRSRPKTTTSQPQPASTAPGPRGPSGLRDRGARDPLGVPFVLVAGPPGSGKSSLAAPLARELGLPLLAKDAIKEALMAVLGPPATVEESRRLGRAAVMAMLAAARSSPGAVLDSTFYPYTRPASRTAAGHADRDSLSVPARARAGALPRPQRDAAHRPSRRRAAVPRSCGTSTT